MRFYPRDPNLRAVANQQNQEAGTADRLVTSARQHFHQSAAKAWVNFQGTGTVTIRDSYNVTSITDNGTGDYTVNLTTSFSSANWSPQFISTQANTVLSTLAAGTAQILARDPTDTNTDASTVSMSGFGDL